MLRGAGVHEHEVESAFQGGDLLEGVIVAALDHAVQPGFLEDLDGRLGPLGIYLDGSQLAAVLLESQAHPDGRAALPGADLEAPLAASGQDQIVKDAPILWRTPAEVLEHRSGGAGINTLEPLIERLLSGLL